MRYRKLDGTGLTLSVVGLGCWSTIGERLDDRQTAALLAMAYEAGVNFFDGAETYADGRSEEAMGRALRLLGWPRETFVVSGKVFYGVHGKRPNTWGLGRKHLVEGCDATLRRLGLEYLDLFLCHRADPDTPLLETVQTMSQLVDRGKVLYWGTSEWPAAQVAAAHDLARQHGLVPPAVEQLQYNMLHRDRVEQEFAEVRDRVTLGVTTWSPLLYGLFAGRYDGGFPTDGRLSDARYAWLRETALGEEPERMLERIRAVNALAPLRGLTPAQMAISWVIRNPAVTSAITGASSPSQLRDTLGALRDPDRLDDRTLAEIDALLGPGPGSGAPPTTAEST